MFKFTSETSVIKRCMTKQNPIYSSETQGLFINFHSQIKETIHDLVQEYKSRKKSLSFLTDFDEALKQILLNLYFDVELTKEQKEHLLYCFHHDLLPRIKGLDPTELGVVVPSIIDYETISRYEPEKVIIEHTVQGNKEISRYNIEDLVTTIDIEYKKLDAKDFTDKGYKCEAIELEFRERYLTNEILSKLDTTVHNTVLLNLGTGSGKSNSIGRLVKELIKDDRNLVIFASPYNVLVQKDNLYLQRNELGIPQELITTKLYIEKNKEDILDKIENFTPIQILSVHFLLANSGDEIFNQAKYKSQYLKKLMQYCKNEEKRVFLIFDELHESLYNFISRQIYHLFKWKGLIHKVIVSTATVTPGVEIVLKHLSYLTDDKVELIRAKRKQLEKDNLAKLKIVFTDRYTPKDIQALSYIKEVFSQQKEAGGLEKYGRVHVLSYSKDLVDAIIDEEWINLPYNRVVSSSSDQFNRKLNNIGTTFKTGVNLLDEDHLIVILPCNFSEVPTDKEFGIFADGVSSITQGLSRVRNKGLITILCMMPPVLLEGSYLGLFKALGYKFKIEKVTDYGKDRIWLETKYMERYRSIKEIQEAYNSSENDFLKRPRISYPSLEDFILEHGQRMLVSHRLMSGKYITPYVIWGAFNNQFANSKLVEIVRSVSKTVVLDYSLDSPYLVMKEHIEKYYEGDLKDDSTRLNCRELYTMCLPLLTIVEEKGLDYSVEFIRQGNSSQRIVQYDILMLMKVVLIFKGAVDVDYRSNAQSYFTIQRYASRLYDIEDSILDAYRIIDQLAIALTNLIISDYNSLLPKSYVELSEDIFTDTNIKKLDGAISVLKKMDAYIPNIRSFFSNTTFNEDSKENIYHSFVKYFLVYSTNENRTKIRVGKNKQYKIEEPKDVVSRREAIYF